MSLSDDRRHRRIRRLPPLRKEKREREPWKWRRCSPSPYVLLQHSSLPSLASSIYELSFRISLRKLDFFLEKRLNFVELNPRNSNFELTRLNHINFLSVRCLHSLHFLFHQINYQKHNCTMRKFYSVERKFWWNRDQTQECINQAEWCMVDVKDCDVFSSAKANRQYLAAFNYLSTVH